MSIDDITNAYIKLIGKENARGAFFVDSEESHGLTQKGVDLGYSFTKEEVETLAGTLGDNDSIILQLEALDKFVSRETEDLIIAANTDSFLVGKVNEKKTLRGQLV